MQAEGMNSKSYPMTENQSPSFQDACVRRCTGPRNLVSRRNSFHVQTRAHRKPWLSHEEQKSQGQLFRLFKLPTS
ncbi:unnamed protein product [Zymoseptoria tritici ST99CH_1A5]|uniref:Uncharacterized protein n=2 Tax=Zymoseptoria tritici TaxID=1047171 RepID=A0A1X7RMQ0_ZYMT9|nr:unnamed protein product [Zymoseptoria tritici ST99CH_3D7]SMR49677.1 unnamed protein product [Zymoseptoria tritici ST99CH_3D1]SMY22374.1 unnamed protein product [Zymoseptoria tritici ST99CH_1A5]